MSPLDILLPYVAYPQELFDRQKLSTTVERIKGRITSRSSANIDITLEDQLRDSFQRPNSP